MVGFFSIIGVLSAVFSTYIAFLAYSQDARAVEGGFVHVIHWKVAQAISPEGYEVRPDKLMIVKSDDEFVVSNGGSVLLTSESRVPFAVRHNSKSSVRAVIMGSSNSMSIGRKEQLPDTHCYV